MTDEIARGDFSIAGFYERRARRILPALTAVVLVTFLAGWFILLPTEFKDLGQSALATALFLSNVYFTLKLDYFSTAAEFAPLLHTWSLAVEEQFYLLFPPVLALLYRAGGRKVAVVALAATSLVSLAAAVVLLPVYPASVFFLIFFRAWELGVGALLALISFKSPESRAARDVLGVVGLLAILIPMMLYDAETPFPGLAALPPVLGAAVLIYVGANGALSFASTVLARKGMVWIGLISYSLYLWHWPIFAFLRIILGTTTLPMLVSLIAIAGSFICAWMSYRYIERPFRKRPPQGFGRGAILAGSAVALAFMTAIGGALHLSMGMPNRLSGSVLEIADAKNDRNPWRSECLGQYPSEGMCPLGLRDSETDGMDFLFWGDSHAEAMTAGIDAAAREAGKSGLFFGMAACPPIKEITRIPERRACTAFKDEVWKFLQGRSDLPLIILAARWTLSAEGNRYRGEAGSTVRLAWAGEAEAAPRSDENATLVEAGLQSTVDAIRATGREVVIVGPVPEVGWDVPAVLARARMMGLPDPMPVSARDYEIRAGETEELLAGIAAADNGVRYLPLNDTFCGRDGCAFAGEDALPYYVDDDHITRTAAETLLAEPLAAIWTETADRP